MTQDSQSPATAGADTPQKLAPTFAIERIYLKDLSFEAPQGAAGFKKQWQPQLTQDVVAKINKIDDEHYEVVLRVTIAVREAEQTAYLAEVHQAGIFLVRGVKGDALTVVLNTHCPAILFPYAREAIDSVVVKGSFPALALPPVNFEALFRQAILDARSKAREAKEAKEAQTANDKPH